MTGDGEVRYGSGTGSGGFSMPAARACGWCGFDLSEMSVRAKYCCLQHKKNAASKRHRERNPGYYAKYSDSATRAAWREANAARIRTQARHSMREHRARNPEATAAYAAAWWAANPDKHRLYQAKRRAAKTAAGVFVVTERDIARLTYRFNGLCAYCATEPATDLDHVVPLKLGGNHSIGNLLPACRSCNASKNATPLFLWHVRTLLQREGERLLALEV